MERSLVTLAGWWGFEGWEDIHLKIPQKRGSILIGVRLFLSLSRIWGNVTSQNSSFSSWDFFVASFPCGCQSSVWIQSGDRWNAKHGKWNMVGCNMTLAYSSYFITERICFMLTHKLPRSYPCICLRPRPWILGQVILGKVGGEERERLVAYREFPQKIVKDTHCSSCVKSMVEQQFWN